MNKLYPPTISPEAKQDERRYVANWLPEMGDPKRHYEAWGLSEPKKVIQWYPETPLRPLRADEVNGYQLFSYYQPDWQSWCGWRWRQMEAFEEIGSV